MYTRLLYILFLLAGSLISSQPLHSQENCNCREAESLRAPMGFFFNSGQLDSASFYARKLLNYKNTACIIFYQGWMAQIAIAEKNTGAARLFLAEEEKLLKEKNCNQDLYVRHYSTLAKMYLELNQQDSFVIAGLKGIDAATKAKDYYGLSRANTDLASAFSSIGQTAKAIFYYRNAMAAAKQQNKVPSLVASVATRLANSYLDLYKETSTSSYADSASILGLEAMSIAEKSKDILAFLEANETMAGYSLQTGKTSEAIRYAEIIIKSSPRGVHLFDRITYAGFSKKAAALYQMKKYEESGIMADSALQYATAFNPQMMISAYENIYLASKANGDSTRGLNAYEKMVAIRDSLFSVEKNNAITELEKKYNQAKNENTIRDLSKKKQIYLLLSIAGILALLAIGFYVRQQSLKHKKVVLETEQRLNQARMNPHFFFNTLTTLQKLALQENHGEVMAGNLARFSNIMRETLESTYKEYISIEQEIDFLTQYLEVQKVHYPDAFSYEIVAAGDLETDELQIPPMIIQPFVENSIEHAFAGLQYKGEIKVAFHLLNKELLIEITDNGKGLPSPGQKNSDHISRATQIIRDRVYLLNRKLKTRAGYQITNNENKPGVLVAIHLPLIYKDQIKKILNMKILLVDNEKAVRETLATMVQNWSNGIHQIEEAEGVKEGVSKINQLNPDIVLLDVEMDDGTGFDLLQQLPQPGFQLIFTTAHNEYAIQAFRYSAIDYLLKPVDPAELRQALERALTNINQRTMQQQLTILLQQFGGRTDTDKQIVLKDVDKTYFIKIRDILFCEAEGSYTKFYLSNAEPIFVSRNLRSYEEILAPAGFIRTHHSCLVNPAKIKIYDRKTDSGTLILEGGHSVPVSQRKKDFVIQFLENR